MEEEFSLKKHDEDEDMLDSEMNFVFSSTSNARTRGVTQLQHKYSTFQIKSAE